MRGAEAFEITNKQTYNFNSMPGLPRNDCEKSPEAFNNIALLPFWQLLASNCMTGAIVRKGLETRF